MVVFVNKVSKIHVKSIVPGNLEDA